MKQIVKLLILPFILTLGLVSCTKDVSLEPISFDTTFTTADQLPLQIAGLYSILETDQLYAQGMWGYLTAGADESFRRDASASVIIAQLYNISSIGGNNQTFWKNLYSGIERANIILDVVDKPVMNETERANIKGQALFLRAYYFFLLVSNYGDVPLKTTVTTDMGTNFDVPRAKAKDVYALIIKDMTTAEGLVQTMEEAKSPTIVTKSAVQAILARVCLAVAGNPVNDESKYKDALMWAEKLINSKVHALNSTPLSQYPNTTAYARLFINNMQNNIYDNNVTEGIWDAAFLSKSNSSGSYALTGYAAGQVLGQLMGIYNPSGIATAPVGYSPGTYRILPKLFNLYGPGDLRRDWIATPYSYKNETTTQYPYITVNITGGGGTGAKATAYTSKTGAMTSIMIDNPGSGYTSAPTISFTSYGNTSVAVNVVAPQLVTAAANIATATATVSGGMVTVIKVTKAGLGYPTIYDRTVGKWRREYEVNIPPIRPKNNTSCNFPIVRYADVLLMAAEADLKVNGSPSATAVGYYNQVRRRAYGYQPLTPVAGFDAITFTMQDIMDERARELCFEGVRRNDLLRWNVMEDVMQGLITDNTTYASTTYLSIANFAPSNFITNPEKYSLFPIPASELSLDRALNQNPGW